MKRYDDLQYNGLILVQDTDYPCFTEDSVLLVNFLQLKKNDKVVDLGSGTGIISVLGQAKSRGSLQSPLFFRRGEKRTDSSRRCPAYGRRSGGFSEDSLQTC